MSDTETTIRPALTAEEWAEFLAPDGVLGWSLADASPSVIGDSVEGRHGAAALMLYGQPFGFTQEDVRALRAAAQSCREDDHYIASELGRPEYTLGREEELAQIYDSLADRVARLLPSPKPTR